MLLSLYCLDFNKENVVWKDELKDNRNSYSGELPDGDYDPPNGLSTTKIYYRCRADGVTSSDPIYLHTDLPFVLFKSGSHLCQKVEGMQVKSEYFYWDCDNEAQWNEVGFSDTQSPRGGTGPTPDIRIDYCYYQPPPVSKQYRGYLEEPSLPSSISFFGHAGLETRQKRGCVRDYI